MNKTLAHGYLSDTNMIGFRWLLKIYASAYRNIPMLRLLSPKLKDTKVFENHLNPVMLVFIG